MGNLDVAVKTIHRQIVTPHLTAEEALQVIRGVNSRFLAPFFNGCVRAYSRHSFAFAVDCAPAVTLGLSPSVPDWHVNCIAIAGAQDLGDATF